MGINLRDWNIVRSSLWTFEGFCLFCRNFNAGFIWSRCYGVERIFCCIANLCKLNHEWEHLCLANYSRNFSQSKKDIDIEFDRKRKTENADTVKFCDSVRFFSLSHFLTMKFSHFWITNFNCWFADNSIVWPVVFFFLRSHCLSAMETAIELTILLFPF